MCLLDVLDALVMFKGRTWPKGKSLIISVLSKAQKMLWQKINISKNNKIELNEEEPGKEEDGAN